MFTRERAINSKGIQSEVEVGSFDGMMAVRKISGRGLKPQELEIVGGVIEPYRETLVRAGLRPPENLTTTIRATEIEVIDQFVGGMTVDQSMEIGEMGGLRDMVRAVIGAEGVFIDAKTPNFIEDEVGVRCIDTFPPMLRGGDRKIEPWVQDLFKRDRDMMSFNFGDVRGQMTKLLSLAQRELPQRYGEVLGVVLSELRGNIDQDDYQYILEQTRQGYSDLNGMYQRPNQAGEIARRAGQRPVSFINLWSKNEVTIKTAV